MDTQTQMQPPPGSGKSVAAGFEDDDIREIGDRVAALSRQDARDLARYLRSKGIRHGSS